MVTLLEAATTSARMKSHSLTGGCRYGRQTRAGGCSRLPSFTSQRYDIYARRKQRRVENQHIELCFFQNRSSGTSQMFRHSNRLFPLPKKCHKYSAGLENSAHE